MAQLNETDVDGGFARYLADLDDSALSEILAHRSDVRANPVPLSFRHLAQRLNGSDSLAAACRVLDRDHLTVTQVIAALAVCAPDSAAKTDELAQLLDAPAGRLDEVLAGLRTRGLLWEDVGGLRLPERLQLHWQTEIGYGRPAAQLLKTARVDDVRQTVQAFGVDTDGMLKAALTETLTQIMSDLPQLMATVRALPTDTRKYRSRVRSGVLTSGMYGRSDHERALAAAGLAIPFQYNAEVPLEVEAAFWLLAHEVRLTGRPELPVVAVDAARLKASATASATDALREITAMLDSASAKPLASLKKGGVGRKALSATARELSIPVERVGLWIDLAYAAGLLDKVVNGYAPTDAFADWRSGKAGDRWATIAHGWHGLEFAPSFRQVDEDKELLPPLQIGGAAGMMRRAMLAAAAPTGSVSAAGREVEWFCPLHGYPPQLRDALVDSAVREAATLGVLAGDVLTELGCRLVEAAGDLDRLRELVAAELPEESCSLTLQSDLTAVVSGQPSTEMAQLLAAAAVTEARGSASVWRFGTDSVRGALDAGWQANDLIGSLRELSGRELPQPLEYLINDVARRHGHVRVRGDMRSCVVADESVITELLHTKSLKKLGLSRLAPTVLSSTEETSKLLARLRSAGFAPVEEAADGSVLIESTGAVRPSGSRKRSGPKRADRVTVESVLDVLRGRAQTPKSDKQAMVFAVLRQLNKRLDDAEIDMLAHALEFTVTVRINYRNRDGNPSTRDIRPTELYGSWMHAWCYLRNGEREFTVANIESVAPAT